MSDRVCTKTNTICIDLSEYRQLLKDQVKLELLEGGGVDNWCGYDDSLFPDFGGDDEYDNYDIMCQEIDDALADTPAE